MSIHVVAPPDPQAEEHRLTHSGCYKTALARAASAELAARVADLVIKSNVAPLIQHGAFIQGATLACAAQDETSR
jgi:hypothetical protein